MLESIRATVTPGTIRRASGMFVTPERRISSLVMTKTAAAVFAMDCAFLAKRPLKPREVMAHLLESIRATVTPGTIRKASGMLVAPERRISS